MQSFPKTGESIIGLASGQFDKNKPTIVLTHGWQMKLPSSWNGAATEFPMQELLGATKSRLGCSFGATENCGANIVTFQWEDAYNPLWIRPSIGVAGAGAKLASQLVDLLGNDYSKNIHFVGHSFGSIVDAAAASILQSSGLLPNSGYKVDQLTILDAPMNVLGQGNLFIDLGFPIGIPISGVSVGLLYDLLPRGTVHYVDNFFGPQPGAFGMPVNGAAPAGGELVGPFQNCELIFHGCVQSEFYAKRVEDKNGSWVTAVLPDTFDSRPGPTEWLGRGDTFLTKLGIVSAELAVGAIELTVDAWHSLVNTATEVTEYVFDVAGKTYRVVADATNTIIKKSKEVVATTVTFVGETATVAIDIGDTVVSIISAPGNKLLSWLRLKESSPVMVGRVVSVPTGASILGFDYDFLNLGDGDWLTVYFEDRLLWTFTGEDFLGDTMHAVIDVSEFAGKEGALYFTLNSTGSRNADVLIGNIEFSSFARTGAAVPEPSSLALVMAAFVLLLWQSGARRSRNSVRWGNRCVS